VVLGIGLAIGISRIDVQKAIRELTLPLQHDDIIRQQAAEKDLDPAMIAAVIYAESRFRDQESHAGALGLMQITPQTARVIERLSGGTTFVMSDLSDPEINIRYGCWYLRHLFGKYHDERLVLAAYNAGQGNVDGWLSRGEEIQFPETSAYVDRVEEVKDIYRDAYGKELGAG